MRQDFLAIFLENPHRARVLRSLIFNENERLTARQIAARAGVSTESASKELEALKGMGVVRYARSASASGAVGKKKSRQNVIWFLNAAFKHLRPLALFVREISPMRYDEIVDALKSSGRLSTVVLSGSFMGDSTRPADILVAADRLNERRLESAVKELEPMFGRELRYAVFSTPEFRYRLMIQDRLLRDTLDFPHLVLLDRSRLLQIL